MNTQAIAYTRTSTRKQTASLELQLNVIRQECDALGWNVCLIGYDENVSGVTPMDDRPSLSRLHAQSSGKVLVVYSLDRLARVPDVGLAIIEKFHAVGCHIVSCVEGINTRASNDIERITNIFEHASWERQMISTRVKDGMARCKETMNPRPPYGYRWVSKNRPLEVVEEEQDVIKFIRDLKEKDPEMSCRAVVRVLNEHPEFPRRGLKEWSVVPVQNIMERHGIPYYRRVERLKGGSA